MKYESLWALDGVSFEVAMGEVFGIVGPNGAGKSTLMKIMARVLPPTDGRVIVRGSVAPLGCVGRPTAWCSSTTRTHQATPTTACMWARSPPRRACPEPSFGKPMVPNRSLIGTCFDAILEPSGAFPERLLVCRGSSDPVECGSSSADFGDDLFGGLVPDERFRIIVPVFGPHFDGVDELVNAGEADAA